MAYSFGAPKIVTNGLVLYLDAANRRSYPGSGTAWNDLSGNGNHGTLTNGPTFNGDNAGSIAFDGVDDRVTFNSSATLKMESSYSFSLWLYVDPLNRNSDELILLTGLGTSGVLTNYSLRRFTTYFGWTLSDGTTAYNITNIYSKTGFVQITCSFNSSASANMYFNGTLASTTPAPYTNYTGGTRTLELGSLVPGGTQNDRHFTGNISQVQIYNRALSAEEVLQNYNATKARYNL